MFYYHIFQILFHKYQVDTDLRNLIRRWIDIHKKLKGSTAPKRISVERSKVLSLLRDVLNDQFTKISVDTKSIFEEVKLYLQKKSVGFCSNFF